MRPKSEQVVAVGQGYARDRVLMMGAAPGDPGSAESNGIMFFPIIPSSEEQS